MFTHTSKYIININTQQIQTHSHTQTNTNINTHSHTQTNSNINTHPHTQVNTSMNCMNLQIHIYLVAPNARG